MPRKMFPSLPEIPGESRQDRFRRIGRALLSVPKSEITPEESLAKLKAKKKLIQGKIEELNRTMAAKKSKRLK